jgi:hypothetical protein
MIYLQSGFALELIWYRIRIQDSFNHTFVNTVHHHNFETGIFYGLDFVKKKFHSTGSGFRTLERLTLAGTCPEREIWSVFRSREELQEGEKV